MPVPAGIAPAVSKPRSMRTGIKFSLTIHLGGSFSKLAFNCLFRLHHITLEVFPADFAANTPYSHSVRHCTKFGLCVETSRNTPSRGHLSHLEI
jgi:hypothetical protein